MVSFKGGIHPPTSKEMTKARPIEHIEEEPQYRDTHAAAYRRAL